MRENIEFFGFWFAMVCIGLWAIQTVSERRRRRRAEMMKRQLEQCWLQGVIEDAHRAEQGYTGI